MKPTGWNYIYRDDAIIRWQAKDDNTVDFTIYRECDSGVLELPDEPYTLDYVLELLEEEL